MSPQFTRRLHLGPRWSASCAIFAAVLISGCASWQLPRIDPSGENLLIWPNQPPPAVVVPAPAVPGAPVVTAPLPGFPVIPPPPPIMPPFGNVQAAPVYSDVPAVPFAPTPAIVAPPSVVGPPVVTVPAAVPPTAVPVMPAAQTPTVAQSIAVPPPGAVPIGQDYLRITPDRILAPVGSEVILKAGICSTGGYLLTDRRVEWLLDRSGPGQFVDVGERNQLDIFRSPMDTPRKIDNWYVVGATAGSPEVLTRGNADPSDDIQVLDGEAWVSVTSASAGTSRITAHAPAVGNWQFRQASATIYWVDAQWIFPPSAVVEPGRPHVLTTTVMRRTDGAPLAGWIVRYEVGSGASLGYAGGNFVEVPVDANGRASVEVSPNNSGGGSTTVAVAIIRPQSPVPDASPRMEIGRSSATITWGAGGTPAPSLPTTPAPAIGVPAAPAPGIPGLPPPPPITGGPTPTPATTTPALEPTPRPSLPNAPSSTNPYTPPRNEPPPGRPQLDVTLRRLGPDAIAVGDYMSFEVSVTNRGDGIARNIEVRDRFDPGLSHPAAKPNEYSVEYLGMRDLGPSESAALPSPLTFKVISGGQQCHEVTVTADGAVPVTQKACVSTRTAAVEISVVGPRQRTVGELAEFNIVVRNAGDVAATDLEVVSKCDPALNPSATEAGHERLADGSIVFRIPRLEPAGRQAFRMVAECISPANNACNHVTANSGGRVVASQDACFEILQQLPANGAGFGNQPAATAPASNLQTTIVITKNPAVIGAPAELRVTIANLGQEAAQQVTLSVLLPVELTPDEAQIQPAGQFTRTGQEIRFRPVGQLLPNQSITAIIPVNPNRPGQMRVQAEVSATGMTAPQRVESQVMTIQTAPL